ncbi:MAG: NUDIX domain-containing protein [Bacillota bacterium]
MNPIFKTEEKRRVCTLVPYYTEDGSHYFFVQKRSAEQTQPHSLGLFGGGMEGEETIEETIEREIREELEIAISGHRFFSTYEFAKNINHVFVLETEPGFAERVTVREGEWGRFISAKEILEHPDVLDGARVIFSQINRFLGA